MRRAVLGVVAAVLVLAVVANFVTEALAEHEISHRAQAATGAQSASASIHSFPFLARLLVSGSVEDVDVRLNDVPVGTLQVQEVELDAQGTSVDRGALFSEQKVKILSMDSATATVTVTAGELSAALGTNVTLPGDGRIVVTVGDKAVPATLRVVGGDVLQVLVFGMVLWSQDLSKNPFVPSCALSVEVGAGEATASCRVQPVPPAVIDVISGTSSS